ncbi:uncharacterized protein LOC109515746 isoform X2 [Hippocampus comes]|uniref:uncharacterized protein LOC109515746 isoform X2 n=1 Tax=Hippocampus comes TaxID=109280 RepID=UPI00094E62CE|nr:PREDICTED: uncharacterized protein LOC109515746 isoform X2 [Hippocampus comes]
MAKFNPPGSFPFDRPTEWADWKQRFQRFRVATKLNNEDGEVQVSSLIYAMGAEAENIFKAFTFADEADKTKFDVVLGKYDEYFYPKRNVIHERACFHQRVQRPGEKVEMFIRALYELSEHCDFGIHREEHIRDRIVVGIIDKEMSRKLQLESQLTLAQTVQAVRQSEEVTRQVHEQGEACAAVQEVSHPKTAFRGKQQWKNEKQVNGEHTEQKCGRCGKIKHREQSKCPAMKSTCNKCKKVGHWERMCHSKSIKEVTDEETVSQTPYFLGAVTDTTRESDKWTVEIVIGATPVKFKIDTGADLNIMEKETFDMLVPEEKLVQSNIPPMNSPGGQLNCVGKFQANAKYKGKYYSFPVFVIHSQTSNNLLGKETACAMGLVKRIEEVHNAFGEHGTLKTEPVEIKLKDNAEPYAVHTARRVPLPLLGKVKEELQRMEKYKIIEKVTDPTDWCAMVPVPRKNGQVRICVDLKKLNEAVKRERFVLPTAEEITAKLCGATTFTSLDADHQDAWGTPAVVTGDGATPRSYVIETHKGATLRRNRRHLLCVPASSGDTPPPQLQHPRPEATVQRTEMPPDTLATPITSLPQTQDGQLFTRSGRLSKPVNRLNL